MVYGILKLLNFAHGDVYMVGAFVGFFVLRGLGGPVSPNATAWIVVSLMFLAAMAACGGLGVLIERVAYRPLRNAPRIAPLISALGVSFFLQNSAQLLFGAAAKSYDTFGLVPPEHGIHWGNLNAWWIQVLVVASAFVMMLVLTWLVQRTKVG